MSTLLATTDFTGTNGAAWPTALSGAVSGSLLGTKSIQSNTGQMAVGSTSSYFGNDRAAANSSLANTTTDAVVKVKFRFLNTTYGGVNATKDNVYPSVWVRANGTMDSASGYRIELTPFANTLSVDRVQAYGGTNSLPLGTGSISATIGTWYWIAFGAVGTTIQYMTWQDGTSQPLTWQGAYTDSFITSGSVGLQAGKADVAGAKVQWDDFTVYSTFAEALSPPSGTVTGATTFGSTVTGMRTGSGAVTGASTFGSSVTGRRTDSGASTGATTFSSTVTGVALRTGTATGATTFGSSVSGAAIQAGSVTGGSLFSSTVSGTTNLLASATGATTFGATVSGGVGLYFRTPAFKQHPRDRHPLIARTYIAVGVTLLKFGGTYRTYIDTDPELISEADKVYLGGHLYFVDFNEVLALRQAGYGQWLSVDYPSSSNDDFSVVDYSQYGAGNYGTGPYGA